MKTTTGVEVRLQTSARADQATGEETYPDLQATVLRESTPDALLLELDGLYSSLFSTADWFETHDESAPTGTCILEQPRHLLFFFRKGDTIEVLNKACAIPSADVERACRALFRAFPKTRRIHIQVSFPPGDLALPHRRLYVTRHMVITLPPTLEEYEATLGKSMRRTVRSAHNRLRRDHGGLSTERVSPGERAGELFEMFLNWKIERFRAHDRVTYWEEHAGWDERFIRLLERRGYAYLTTIGGELAAIVFAFPVGDSACGQESSFDPRYEPYRLGVLSQLYSIQDAICYGARSMDTLWGNEAHKAHYRAEPVTYTALSVFPRQVDRLWSLREEAQVIRRSVKRTVEHYYWATRHRVGRVIRRRPDRTAENRQPPDQPN